MNWKGRNKEEIPGSKRTDLLQALKRELLSSVFSLDETLICASAAPHCWDLHIQSNMHVQLKRPAHSGNCTPQSGISVPDKVCHGVMVIMAESNPVTRTLTTNILIFILNILVRVKTKNSDDKHFDFHPLHFH